MLQTMYITSDHVSDTFDPNYFLSNLTDIITRYTYTYVSSIIY